MYELPLFVSSPSPSIYEWGTPLFVDFETTTVDKGSALSHENRLVLTCWKLGYDSEVKHNWNSEFDQAELLADIAKADFLVAHNAKFELQWLVRCGVDISKIVVYDTMLAEYVIGGNRWMFQNLSLEKCLRRHGLPGKISVISKMIKAGICPSEIPTQWLLEYCSRDVTALVDLISAQLSGMAGTRLLPVVYSRCLLTPVLADIEKYGMKLDGDLVRTKFNELTEQVRDLEIKMNALTGGVDLDSTLVRGVYIYETLGFEEKKEKRQGKWVTKKTPTGRYLTDADTIASLRAVSSDQKRFHELYFGLNDAKQALSKYITKWKDCVEENAGLLSGTYNQTSTQTQRLSSSGRKYKTQMQNLPRAYKYLFCSSDPDYLLGEADGAQLEFRVAAHMGRDPVAYNDIRNGVDVHAFTAAVLTGAGQPTSRQDAKTHTFKPLYGGSSGTQAEQTYYRAFKEKYKGIADAQQKWIASVLQTKFLETEWGLRYYWPDTRMDRSGYVSNSTAICNYPVQAFATAEIIPLCLVAMWHVIQSEQLPIRIVNTVHDSIVAEVQKGCEDIFHALSKWALTEFAYDVIERLYGIKLECQLGAEVTLGSHWGCDGLDKDGNIIKTKGTKYESQRVSGSSI
jgi:DNA polymerase-1